MKSSAAAAVGRSKAAEGFKVSMKKVRGSSSKESFKALPLVYRARGLVHEGAHARAETDRQRLVSHGRRKIESYNPVVRNLTSMGTQRSNFRP